MSQRSFFQHNAKHSLIETKTFDNKEYKRITGYVSIHREQLFYSESSGRGGREVLFVDDTQPIFKRFFEDFLQDIALVDAPTQPLEEMGDSKQNSSKPTKTTQEYVLDLLTYTRNHFIASKEDEDHDDIENILKTWCQENKKEFRSKNETDIPLHVFLERKQGVCRHIALIFAVILKKLSTHLEWDIQGIYYSPLSFLKNDKINRSRHGLILFEDKEHLFILDPTLNSWVDFSKLQKESSAQQKVILNQQLPNWNFESIIEEITNWQKKKPVYEPPVEQTPSKKRKL